MGLFDKLKGIVKGAQDAAQPQQQQAQQQQPQQQQYQAQPEPEPEDVEEDEEQDDSEADDWGGWDPHNHEEFWFRLKAIEKAGNDGGDDACDAKCREYGIRDWGHMGRVRDTFNRHFGHTHEFVQAAMNAGNRQAREQFGAAAASNPQILEPVEGIDIKTYSFTQARAMGVGNDMGKWAAILAENGMDQAKWDRVNTEWQRRMSGQAGDMNATMALMTEYGKYFGMAQQGQFGASAAANAGQAGTLNQGQGAVGAEPCTLERYAEIGGAQSAWSQQGRDVNAMLQQQFGMNALDWSNLSQYWSAKIGGDYRIGLRYSELQTHYEQQYKAQGGSFDDDLSV
ncbi:MAG: hypothetical protein IPQ07_30895 [Myxococcales bacterium]|nr:hypothetical protein [Myxococcales bacterium]